MTWIDYIKVFDFLSHGLIMKKSEITKYPRFYKNNKAWKTKLMVNGDKLDEDKIKEIFKNNR